MSEAPAPDHLPHQNIDDLLRRLDEMEKKVKTGPDPAAEKRDNIVVYTCLVLGVICIICGLVGMFLGIAASAIWVPFLVGAFLCGISLFKKFKLGPDGLSGTMRNEIIQLTQYTRNIINTLR
jgi:hypothetical protein